MNHLIDESISHFIGKIVIIEDSIYFFQVGKTINISKKCCLVINATVNYAKIKKMNCDVDGYAYSLSANEIDEKIFVDILIDGKQVWVKVSPKFIRIIGEFK